MLKTRVIPSLLLKNAGLVKTVRFKNPQYIGDPINTVKIFNEKEVDEIVILDILATKENKRPPLELLTQIVSEAFMPVGYGGGIRSLDDIREILSAGVEKVSINSLAAEDPSFIQKAADLVGSQSVVVSMDVRKKMLGKYEVYSHAGSKRTRKNPVEYAREMENAGAGELLVYAVDLDGTMKGYDTELIRMVADAVRIPVIACGGAGSVQDFPAAVEAGASAVAAGSMFVFQGKHKAVLINYPDAQELKRVLG